VSANCRIRLIISHGKTDIKYLLYNIHTKNKSLGHI
jgi:hypothetical protein